MMKCEPAETYEFEACVGKERFETGAEAVKAARNHQRRRKGKIASYCCPYCKKFHVGGSKK
jgi:hypothetical protein